MTGKFSSKSWRHVLDNSVHQVLTAVPGVATSVLFGGADHKPIAAVQMLFKDLTADQKAQGVGGVAIPSPAAAAAVAAAVAAAAAKSAHSRVAVMFNASGIPVTYVLTNFTSDVLHLNLITTDASGDKTGAPLNGINVIQAHQSVEVNADYSCSNKQFVLEKYAAAEGKHVTAEQDTKAQSASQCLYLLASVTAPESARPWAEKNLPTAVWKTQVDYITVACARAKAAPVPVPRPQPPNSGMRPMGVALGPANRTPAGPLFPGAGLNYVPPPPVQRAPYENTGALLPLPSASIAAAAASATAPGVASAWRNSHGASLSHGESLRVDTLECHYSFMHDTPARALHFGVSITDDIYCVHVPAPDDLALAAELMAVAAQNMEAKVELSPPFESECCVVCYDLTPHLTFYPCAHRCVCVYCLGKLGPKPICPLCRAPVLATRSAKKSGSEAMYDTKAVTKNATVPIQVLERERQLHQIQLSMERDNSVPTFMLDVERRKYARLEQQYKKAVDIFDLQQDSLQHVVPVFMLDVARDEYARLEQQYKKVVAMLDHQKNSIK